MDKFGLEVLDLKKVGAYSNVYRVWYLHIPVMYVCICGVYEYLVCCVNVLYTWCGACM
jgi:hypothetical protein